MNFLQTKITNRERGSTQLFVKLFVCVLFIIGLSSCATPPIEITPTVVTEAISTIEPTETPEPVHTAGVSRGYLTTPQELSVIAKKAEQGIEPYQSTVSALLQLAEQEWDFQLNAEETCPSADEPEWNDNGGGTPILFSKAIAYHLSGDVRYAEEVKDILQQIMTDVEVIVVDPRRCQLTFAWGTPELVASADLVEDYWIDKTCTGPLNTAYLDPEIGTGNCKELFQNWLAKNPYYVISLLAENSKANAGAAATNTLAHIADYLWDRPELELVHRLPPEISDEEFVTYSPSEAFVHANQLAIDRMNGYGVEYGSSSSCDYLEGEQQKADLPPVKSQITELGIIPEDARRQEYCNILQYNGEYQNYPQLHLGHNIQQCELMLRRGDSSCFDNVDMTDIPDYTFIGPDGQQETTHLRPGRGSIERAIKAIIIDSNTEWNHDPALEVAFHYYFANHTLEGFEFWAEELLDHTLDCGQDVCFGGLTHSFSVEEEFPSPPPTVPPP